MNDVWPSKVWEQVFTATEHKNHKPSVHHILWIIREAWETTTLFLHWQLVSSWTDSCSIVPATTPMWGDNGTTSEEEDTWKETDLQCRNDSYRSASFITVLPLYFWVSASLQQPTSRYVFGNLHGPSKFHLVRHKHLYSRNTKGISDTGKRRY